MAKATFPAQSQTVAESVKPADGDGFTPSDHRNAYSALYQGDYSPLRPRAKSPAALAIEVAAAEIEGFFRNLYWNNNHVKFAGGDSPNFTAPASNPRIDLLVLDVSGGPTGVLTRIAGTEAASPAEPALPDLKTNIPLCYVYNRVGQTKVVNFEDSGANPTEGYIYRDVRPWVPPGGGATLGGTPTTSAVGDAAAEGASGNAAKGDHRHGRESAGTPVTQAFGDAAAQGAGPSVSYGDHRHGMPAKPSGGWTNLQIFTASGTWVKPAGVTKVFVEVWGGGGGGGGGGGCAGSTNPSSGGGGGGGAGGGGYASGIVTVSGDVTVTVGAGGSAGAGGNDAAGSAGGSGGASSFGSNPAANGGSGGSGGGRGQGGNSGSGGGGGSGAAATAGDLQATGATGQRGGQGGQTDGSANGTSPKGGAGGMGGTVMKGGGAGQKPAGGGTGGDGASWASGQPQTGGGGAAGGIGMVLVTWNE